MMTAHPKVLGPVNNRVPEDIKRYLPEEWKKIEFYIDEVWMLIEELIREGVERGCLRPVNLAVLRKIFIGGLDEMSNFEFLRENNLTVYDAINNMTDILVSGLVVQTKTDN
jgi:hypothetical protein